MERERAWAHWQWLPARRGSCLHPVDPFKACRLCNAVQGLQGQHIGFSWHGNHGSWCCCHDRRRRLHLWCWAVRRKPGAARDGCGDGFDHGSSVWGSDFCRCFDHLLLSVGSAAFTLLCALAAVTTIAVAAATAAAFFLCALIGLTRGFASGGCSGRFSAAFCGFNGVQTSSRSPRPRPPRRRRRLPSLRSPALDSLPPSGAASLVSAC